MLFVDDDVRSDSLRRRLRRVGVGERIEEAEAFLRAFHDENGLDPYQRDHRIRQAARGLRRSGLYLHTPDELAFGARVAWRNHARCIGRLNWKALEVLDCRALRHPFEVVQHLGKHLRLAHNGGQIRSVISIFPPFEDGKPSLYIENRQITQYAGYQRARGRILGDPQNVEFTRSAMALGWRPPRRRSAFDLLPVIVRDGGRRQVFELPPGCVHQIDIRHPTRPRIADLGLKWHAVPVVSDMILTIGGIDYPCAPFNGHYMATEIASRNFADSYRYDLMDDLANALEVDTGDMLWKDVVLSEINRAVLHSFQSARTTIVDHHLASTQFMTFRERELALGRHPSGEWSWIVPPQAGSACPVFHLNMHDLADVPNFYRARAIDGDKLKVSRVTEERSWPLRMVDRIKRRWRRHRRRRQ